jgi:hypothetical protein
MVWRTIPGPFGFVACLIDESTSATIPGVWFRAARDCGFESFFAYTASSGTTFRIGGGHVPTTRVRLSNGRVEPYSGTAAVAVRIDPQAKDTVLSNVSIDARGGIELRDRGVATRLVNVNGVFNHKH